MAPDNRAVARMRGAPVQVLPHTPLTGPVAKSDRADTSQHAQASFALS